MNEAQEVTRRSPVWRQLGTVIGACGLLGALLLVLWLVARDAPSSEVGQVAQVVNPPVSASAGCENFARYWIEETSVGATPEMIEGFTNCRLGDDGVWRAYADHAARGGAPHPAPEDVEAARSTLRLELLTHITALEDVISPELGANLDLIFRAEPEAVFGQIEPGRPISATRARYARVINAFDLDPARSALADYVGWIMEQRIVAYTGFRQACLAGETDYLRDPCVGMEDNLSIRYAPFPWQLRDPMYLDAYVEAVYPTE